jgi:hypothetical protein
VTFLDLLAGQCQPIDGAYFLSPYFLLTFSFIFIAVSVVVLKDIRPVHGLRFTGLPRRRSRCCETPSNRARRAERRRPEPNPSAARRDEPRGGAVFKLFNLLKKRRACSDARD